MSNFCQGSHHCLQLLRRVRGRWPLWIARSFRLDPLKALIQLVLHLKKAACNGSRLHASRVLLCRRQISVVWIQDPVVRCFAESIILKWTCIA